MSLLEVLASDRRLVILQSLAAVEGWHLNELVLRQALAHVGHEASRDMVRGDIGFLRENGLVRCEEIENGAGRLWLATLTDEGLRVVNGRTHPGVARPGPK